MMASFMKFAIFLAINKLKVRRILPSAILITVCQRTYNMVFGCISMCTVWRIL